MKFSKVKNLVKKVTNRAKNIFFGAGVYVFCTTASYAQLPQLKVNGSTPSGDDPVETFKEIVLSVGGVVIALLTFTAFIVVLKNAVAAFDDWQKQKKSFFEFGILVAIALALLIGICYIGNMALDKFSV